MISKVNNENFWEERYVANNIPWDIGKTAPAFVKYFQNSNLELRTSSFKFAVLGCGRGHDSFYFATLNKNTKVYCFDFSESAIRFCNETKEKNNIKNINFYHIDFFNLIREKEKENHFDYLIEHTSFCAVDPLRRKEYANLIKYLLKPGGKLIGLFFIRPRELGGPPFGSTKEEIRELFKNDFTETEELHYESCPHTFTGEEHFGIFEKRVQ